MTIITFFTLIPPNRIVIVYFFYGGSTFHFCSFIGIVGSIDIPIILMIIIITTQPIARSTIIASTKPISPPTKAIAISMPFLFSSIYFLPSRGQRGDGRRPLPLVNRSGVGVDFMSWKAPFREPSATPSLYPVAHPTQKSQSQPSSGSPSSRHISLHLFGWGEFLAGATGHLAFTITEMLT